MNDELREKLENMLAGFKKLVVAESVMRERHLNLRDSGITRDDLYKANKDTLFGMEWLEYFYNFALLKDGRIVMTQTTSYEDTTWSYIYVEDGEVTEKRFDEIALLFGLLGNPLPEGFYNSL